MNDFCENNVIVMFLDQYCDCNFYLSILFYFICIGCKHTNNSFLGGDGGVSFSKSVAEWWSD